MNHPKPFLLYGLKIRAKMLPYVQRGNYICDHICKVIFITQAR
jgi:hypothetical protein